MSRTAFPKGSISKTDLIARRRKTIEVAIKDLQALSLRESPTEFILMIHEPQLSGTTITGGFNDLALLRFGLCALEACRKNGHAELGLAVGIIEVILAGNEMDEIEGEVKGNHPGVETEQ